MLAPTAAGLYFSCVSATSRPITSGGPYGDDTLQILRSPRCRWVETGFKDDANRHGCDTDLLDCREPRLFVVVRERAAAKARGGPSCNAD